MDITDLVNKDKDKEQEQKETIVQLPETYTIPEDADFLTDIDELTQLVHANIRDLYSNPEKATEESLKNIGAMLAILDKYIHTRKEIHLITSIKIPI